MGIVCICPFIQKQNGEKQASIRYKQHMLHEQHDTELICSVPFFSECTEGPAIRRDLLNGCRIRIEFFVYYCCCCRSYCYSSYCSLVDFIYTIYADNSSFFSIQIYIIFTLAKFWFIPSHIPILASLSLFSAHEKDKNSQAAYPPLLNMI